MNAIFIAECQQCGLEQPMDETGDWSAIDLDEPSPENPPIWCYECGIAKSDAAITADLYNDRRGALTV